MKLHQVITGPEAMKRVASALDALPTGEELYEVIIRPWEKPGSSNQLRTIHMWYNEITRDRPEYDKNYWECFCKYEIGVPVLIEDQEYFEFFKKLFEGYPKWKNGWYEQRVAIMRHVGVVSEMNRKQRTNYMNGILHHEAFRDVRFTDPKPEKRKR